MTARTLFPAGSSGSSKGILGRAMEALTAQGDPDGGSRPPLKSESYAFGATAEMLLGDPDRRPVQVGVAGIQADTLTAAERASTMELWSHQEGSIFAQTATSQSRAGMAASRRLSAALENVTLADEGSFKGYRSYNDFTHNYMGSEFKTVVQLMLARKQLGTERDVFYVRQGGYDTHNDGGELALRFDELDTSLEVLVTELKAQGLYDNVAIQVISEFGRTLTYNGRGSDHAWSGNYFLMGGQVKGGKIHGSFPSLDRTGDHCIDTRRGTLIPTLPWEAQWVPLLQWFGVHDDQLEHVMPNLKNFAPAYPQHLDSEHLLKLDEVFKAA